MLALLDPFIAKPLSKCAHGPIDVGNADKICKSWTAGDGLHILCDIDRFPRLSPDERVEQIHHEFATNVTGLEPDDGPLSSYKISVQLSGGMANVVERKLVAQSFSTSTGPGDTRTTISGHKFTQVTNQSALGNAWKDESGLIWGDLITKDKMSKEDIMNYCSGVSDTGPCYMTQQRAGAYCNSLSDNQHQYLLPTKAQFEQLAKYLGDGSDTGYNPEPKIIPNLIENYFWSGSVFPAVSDSGYGFFGSDGIIGNGFRSNCSSVRCVGR